MIGVLFLDDYLAHFSEYLSTKVAVITPKYWANIGASS